MVTLNELKSKQYDMIYSLGYNCFPGIYMKKYALRKQAGVIDWCISISLSYVNQLLKHRCKDLFVYEHLTYVSSFGDGSTLRLRDKVYQIDSAHDFPSSINTETNWLSYNEVKEKYERRTERFLTSMETSSCILFIRMGGTYEEAKELENILKGMVKNDFYILLLTNSEKELLSEANWDLPCTCVLHAPIFSMDVLRDDKVWEELLSGLVIK